MSLKERLKKAVASQAEIEADEERADAHRSVGCTPVDQLADRSRASVSGVIRSVTLRPREGVPALEAELYDGSGVARPGLARAAARSAASPRVAG